MAFFEKIKQTFKKNKDKDTYLSGLSKSRKTFGEKDSDPLNNFRGINEELLEEIMVILLESDMGYATAQKVVDEFEARSKELKDFDSMEDYLINILYDFYNPSKDEPIHFNEEGPTVILMVGVNGSGKTTTSAKLISYFREQGKIRQSLQQIHFAPVRSARLKSGPSDWMHHALPARKNRIQPVLWSMPAVMSRKMEMRF